MGRVPCERSWLCKISSKLYLWIWGSRDTPVSGIALIQITNTASGGNLAAGRSAEDSRIGLICFIIFILVFLNEISSSNYGSTLDDDIIIYFEVSKFCFYRWRRSKLILEHKACYCDLTIIVRHILFQTFLKTIRFVNPQ